MNTIKQYLAAIGRKGGQKSRRKLTKAQARAMVRARMAKRAALRPNDQAQRPALGENSQMLREQTQTQAARTGQRSAGSLQRRG